MNRLARWLWSREENDRWVPEPIAAWAFDRLLAHGEEVRYGQFHANDPRRG